MHELEQRLTLELLWYKAQQLAHATLHASYLEVGAVLCDEAVTFVLAFGGRLARPVYVGHAREGKLENGAGLTAATATVFFAVDIFVVVVVRVVRVVPGLVGSLAQLDSVRLDIHAEHQILFGVFGAEADGVGVAGADRGGSSYDAHVEGLHFANFLESVAEPFGHLGEFGVEQVAVFAVEVVGEMASDPLLAAAAQEVGERFVNVDDEASFNEHCQTHAFLLREKIF